jgi:hypothetical protein
MEPSTPTSLWQAARAVIKMQIHYRGAGFLSGQEKR